jgi:hypothetical protein
MVELREFPPERFDQRSVFRRSPSNLPDVVKLPGSSPAGLVDLVRVRSDPTSGRHHAMELAHLKSFSALLY